MLRPSHGLLNKGSGTSSFEIGDKKINFTLTKSNKGMQRKVLLDVGRQVQMMHNLYFDFPAKDKIFPSKIICVDFQL